MQEKLFTQVVTLLTQRGMILNRGTIVGSTFIEAPSSTKNEKKERDPDAHSGKNGNVWHCGYKAYIGMDKDSCFLYTINATPANKHDVTLTSDLLTGEDEQVYGDSRYLGTDKLPEEAGKHPWQMNTALNQSASKLGRKQLSSFKISNQAS